MKAKYQSGTSFCIEIFDSTSRTCMTVADAVRLKEELTKAIDDSEIDKKKERRNNMTANELQIGDWVQIDGEIGNVSFISVLGDINVIINEAQMIVARNPNPIPLTAEILEKNFPEPTDGITWYPEEGGFNCHTYMPDCEINAFGLFKYVHELQHALRLCGIEKEIIL